MLQGVYGRKKKPLWLFLLPLFLLPVDCFSLGLPYLIQTAIQNHPSIQSSIAQFDAATEAKKSALWQFFPTPSMQVQNASSSDNNPNFSGDDLVYSVSLEQPIWQGGKRIAKFRLAKIDMVIANAQVNEKRYEIAFELIKAYGNWMSAYLKMSALNESTIEHKKMLTRVQNRFNAGVSNQGDIDLALSRLESTKSELLNVTFEQSSALSQITEIVNEIVSTEALATEMARPKKQRLAFDLLMEKTLAGHPRMIIVRNEMQKAKKNISTSRASLWPDIYFRAERQFGHFAYKDSKPTNTFLVGMRSQLGPGLSSVSHIKMSTAQLKSAKMDIEVETRKLKQQIIEDQIMEKSLRARKKSVEITLSSAKNVFDSYSRQFLAGKKSWQDLMNSLREMTANKIKLADINATRVVITTRQNININGLSDYRENQSE